MKNLTLLLLFAFVAMSCGDDIESNTPSIQGEVNGQFFRSNVSTAYLNMDGSVTLTGNTGLDIITLKTSALEVGQYNLGKGSQNEAAYLLDGLNLYATGTTGDGAIEITNVEQNTLSGEFYFNAINGDTLNINKGSFFEVPITNMSGGEGEVVDCAEASLATINASQAYQNADPQSDDFNSICLAYQTALEIQIEYCGDEDGVYQTELDSLSCVSE